MASFLFPYIAQFHFLIQSQMSGHLPVWISFWTVDSFSFFYDSFPALIRVSSCHVYRVVSVCAWVFSWYVCILYVSVSVTFLLLLSIFLSCESRFSRRGTSGSKVRAPIYNFVNLWPKLQENERNWLDGGAHFLSIRHWFCMYLDVCLSLHLSVPLSNSFTLYNFLFTRILGTIVQITGWHPLQLDGVFQESLDSPLSTNFPLNVSLFKINYLV